MLNEDMNLVYYDLKDIMASRSLKSGFVNCHCSPGLLLILGGILRYVNESNIAIGCICVLKWHFRKFQSTWFMIHGRNDFFKQLSNEVFHEMRFKYCTYFDYFANATNFTITANIMRSTILKQYLLIMPNKAWDSYNPQFFK